MNKMTEIVTMTLNEGISAENFLSIVNELEINFHSKQPGYLDTELLQNEKDGTWIMIQHWDCVENLKAASRKMFSDSSTEAFRNVLIPQNVKITIHPQLGTWSISEM